MIANAIRTTVNMRPGAASLERECQLRICRIFTEQALEPESPAVLEGDAAHYLARVLRATTGQPVVLFNGDGADYASEICSMARDRVELRVLSRLPARSESPLRITLVQGLSRGERMDLILQKATELGVAAIQPVFTARSEVRLKPDRLQRRMEHWRRVIVTACEQSGRARVPTLVDPVDVRVWAQREATGVRILLHPGGDQQLARLQPGGAVELLIGPEGGLEDQELETLQHLGIKPVSLGPRILRTETAGPAAIAVLQAVAGDFA